MKLPGLGVVGDTFSAVEHSVKADFHGVKAVGDLLTGDTKDAKAEGEKALGNVVQAWGKDAKIATTVIPEAREFKPLADIGDKVAGRIGDHLESSGNNV